MGIKNAKKIKDINLEPEMDYIVKDDMICPVTKSHCDDECCPVGSTCNMSGDDILDCGDHFSGESKENMEPEMDIFDQWAKERESKPWIIRKLEFIPMWWSNDGKYLHKQILTGLKNLWYWFPVIWKDRHWDDHYIFEVMIHKLKAQSKYIGERDWHTTAKRDAEIMMTCVRLMKLVREEHYCSEYMDYHETKHWFANIPGKEGYSSWESRQLSENFDDFFKKHQSAYKKVLADKKLQIFRIEPENCDDETDIKQRIAMNIGHYNHNRARKLLFKLMEENIESWWD